MLQVILSVINLNEDNHDDVLNVPISQAEIKNVILSLHNDKSSGLDNVTNEYLKDTATFASEDMCYNTNTPTYRNYTFIKNKVKQFRIYWNHKMHSIFKRSKNYKAFTLMRYLGKVFTGILNNRLASLSDEIGLLSSAQAGFRNACLPNIAKYHL
jgi:hypothetical protein